MEKEGTHIFVDMKIRKIVKLEAVKRDISMKKLVHDAVIEYVERHKIERIDLLPAKKTPEKEGNLTDYINIKEKKDND